MWNIYDTTQYSYNEDLKNIIEEKVEQDELIILPLNETRYLYHYGLPNVAMWLYPPFELTNLDKTFKYFEDLELYNQLIMSSNCEEFTSNFNKLKLDIEKIILPKSSKLFEKKCNYKIMFYED